MKHYSIKAILCLFGLFFFTIGLFAQSKGDYIRVRKVYTTHQSDEIKIYDLSALETTIQQGRHERKVSRYAVVKLIYGREKKTDIEGDNWNYELDVDILNQTNAILGSPHLVVETGSTANYESVQRILLPPDMTTVAFKVTNIFADNGVLSGSNEELFEDLNGVEKIKKIIPEDLRIEYSIETEKHYFLNPYEGPELTIDPSATVSDHRCDLYWDYIYGADEYEVQWAFIDELMVNKPTGEAIFERSITANISNTWYSVNTIFPKGDLYFRVRPIGKYIYGVNDFDKIKTGAWSMVKTIKILEANGFEKDKNWEYSQTFAEDGKQKGVVTYYDQSLRSRQIQTNLSTEETTLLAENKYDFEGRPSLSILPTPAIDPGGNLNNTLFYKSGDLSNPLAGYNKLDATNSYEKQYFDKSDLANPLSTDMAHGAAGYFSPNNTLSNQIHNELIPDAKGFPITQTKFTRDGTGRVVAQGGIGPTFQIGNGHDTKYLYGSANGTELRRLFGSNVGISDFYKKNTVIDANGQVSVSYIDQAGRVVATALSEENPSNVEPIFPGPSDITVNLNDKNNIDRENRVSHLEYTIPYAKTIPSDYDFTFDLTGVNEQWSFNGINSCKSCIYKLTIQVYDPDGFLMVPITASPENPVDGVVLSGQSCPDNTYDLAQSFELKFSFDKIGEYRVVKKLDLLSDTVDASFLEDIGLLTSYEDLQNTYNINFPIDELECAFTCEQCSTLAGQQRVDCFAECEAALANVEQFYLDNRCSSLRNQMLADVSPGGWMYESDAFLETAIPAEVDETSADAIRANWEDTWAMAYLPNHREECHLTFCESPRGESSDLFDRNLSRASEDWLPGMAWSDIQNEQVYKDLFDNAEEAWKDNDPFFIGLPSSFVGEMMSFVKTDLNGTGTGVYSMFDYIAHLQLPLDATPNPGAAYTDLEAWNALVGMYLGAKEKVKESYLETSLALGGLGCEFQTDANAIRKKSGSLALDVNQSYQDGQANMVEHCDNLCEGNVAVWMELLGQQCDAILDLNNQGIYDEVESLLTSYCLNGCTSNTNPYGVITADLGNPYPDPNSDPIASDIWQLLLDAETLIDNLFQNAACVDADGLLTSSTVPYVVDGDFETGITYTFTETVTIPGVDVIDACEPCEILSRYIDFGEWMEVAEDEYVWRPGSWNLSALQEWLVASPSYNRDSTITPIHIVEAIKTCVSVHAYPFHENDPECSFYYDNPYSYLSNFFGCPGIWDISGFGLPGPNVDIQSICETDGQGAIQAANEIYSCARDNFNCFELPCNNHPNENSFPCPQTQTGCSGWMPIEAFYARYGILLNQTQLNWIIAYYTDQSWPEGVFDGQDVLDHIAAHPNACTLPPYVVTGVNFNFEYGLPSYDATAFTECVDLLNQEQNFNFTLWYQKQVDEALTQLHEGQLDNCFSQPYQENFFFEYTDLEYHYTLYYYDQAGNLVQTVPPKGVNLLPSSAFNGSGEWLSGNEPNHTLVTRYQYNSLNQVISQSTPETRQGNNAHRSNFIYDKLGRIRFSQDPQQAIQSDYSYTKYDKLGRIIEVGQIDNLVLALGETMEDFANDPFYPATAASNLSDVIQTFYNKAVATGGIEQNNLRNRVAQTQNESIITRYSYDIHGNVERLYHELLDDSTVPVDMRSFEMEYDYDLISGNVNKVSFNKGKADHFYHKYEYDADNRLTHVYTSKDGEIWHNDARYFYYLHGPLARIELGEDKSQGLDYYYTLQGWIKGVNSVDDAAIVNNQGGAPDFGADGLNDKNRWFANDEAAYKLGYFNGDYQSIGLDNLNKAESFAWMELGNAANSSLSTLLSLYNGNIAWMQTDIPHFVQQPNPVLPEDAKEGLQARIFAYDQLHRITQSVSLEVSGTSSLSGSSDPNNPIAIGYTWNANNLNGTTHSYDPNGNLQSLTRGPNGSVENFNYDYYDEVGAHSDEGNLLKGVSGYNKGYTYDNIGNLTSNLDDNVSDIDWNLQGKVASVDFTPNTGPLASVSYTYDVSGNRLSKTTINNAGIRERTYYIRDASGNMMSTYIPDINSNNAYTITQKEVSLYGSSRLGLQKLFDRTNSIGPDVDLIQEVRTSYRGKKSFELSNHLGNVLSVVSDRKLGYSTGQTADNYVDEYAAAVVSASDYYPFGLQMGGRNYNSPDYLYGFNGKEKDESGEWGSSTHYDYGFRIYNPRIARFLSEDPLSPAYPWYTPYQFAGNKPIWAIDLDGLEEAIGTIKGTGNVIFLYSADAAEALANAPNNSNWDAYIVKNIYEVGTAVDQYSRQYGRLNNFVLKAHGQTMTDNSFLHAYDFGADDEGSAISLHAQTIDQYLSSVEAYGGKGNFESSIRKNGGAWEKVLYNINTLVDITGNIEDGGNCIITGCGLAKSENIGFATQLLTGGRLNLYQNRDLSTQFYTFLGNHPSGQGYTKDKQYFDLTITSESNYNYGWYLYPSFEDGDQPSRTQLGSNLILNSTGEAPFSLFNGVSILKSTVTKLNGQVTGGNTNVTKEERPVKNGG